METEIPIQLLRQIKDSSGPEELACGAIACLAGDPDYPPEEVFAILALTFRVETRREVLEACVKGIVETLARARHADFLEVQLQNFLADRSDRAARILAAVVGEPRVRPQLRIAALELLARYREDDLSPLRLEEIERVLGERLADEGPDGPVGQRILRLRRQGR